MSASLLIRNVSIIGSVRADLLIEDGKCVSFGKSETGFKPASTIDGSKLTAMPGLIDHHLHILATAASYSSVDLSTCLSEEAIVAALRRAADGLSCGAAIRATGLDERAAGLPDVARLSEWLPANPLRIQDRTGALWLLNKITLEQLGSGPWPECVELTEEGNPTGHIWRGDKWLREKLGSQLPPVNTLAKEMLGFGIIGATDASPHNGQSEAKLFEQLIETGNWPLKLQLMGSLELSESASFTRGPLKLHFDERDLPPLDTLASLIRSAREQGRSVAAHCVTEGELVWFVAALENAGGARRGDRVEHGGIIPQAMIDQLGEMSLTIVSNPGFIASRGDRYVAQIPASEMCDLYRANSLVKSGINLAFGSDAPYGPIDPWLAIRSARDRLTQMGAAISPTEAISVENAIKASWLDFTLSKSRNLSTGAEADICLLAGEWSDIIANPAAERVQATLIGGSIQYAAASLQ